MNRLCAAGPALRSDPGRADDPAQAHPRQHVGVIAFVSDRDSTTDTVPSSPGVQIARLSGVQAKGLVGRILPAGPAWVSTATRVNSSSALRTRLWAGRRPAAVSSPPMSTRPESTPRNPTGLRESESLP